MKQKIVIKVKINCEKCRKKTMQVICSTKGVDSIAVEGEDKDHFILIGDGIDSIKLTKSLRKKVGQADIVKVEQLNQNAEISASKYNEANLEYGFSQCIPNYPPPKVFMHEESMNYESCVIM